MANAQQTPVLVAGSVHRYFYTGPLWILRSANMQATGDQTPVPCGAFTNWIITGVVAKWISGAFNTACLGGVYTAASKGGTPLVAATQTWAGLTGAATIVTATMAAATQTIVLSAAPILGLTTGNAAALVADIYFYGYVVD